MPQHDDDKELLLYGAASRLIHAITFYSATSSPLDNALNNRMRATRQAMEQAVATWDDAPLRPLLAQLVLAVQDVNNRDIQLSVLEAKALLQETPTMARQEG